MYISKRPKNVLQLWIPFYLNRVTIFSSTCSYIYMFIYVYIYIYLFIYTTKLSSLTFLWHISLFDSLRSTVHSGKFKPVNNKGQLGERSFKFISHFTKVIVVFIQEADMTKYLYLGPLLLTWFKFKSQHGYVITSIIMCGMKLLILWISNSIPHFTGHVITYPCWD